jgi:hypothetical protein
LRVVPIVLVRSPHEIAMSIFLRSKGMLDYCDALDVTAVHYKRMNCILDSWQGEHAVVRFDPRVFTEDLRRAVEVCHLAWQEDVFSRVYDVACKHHEPACVAHPAEGVYQRLSRLGVNEGDPANLQRLVRDAATREPVIRSRLSEAQEELQQFRATVEQYRQTDSENRQRIDRLEVELARITGSRTWRWCEHIVRTPPLKWLANSPPVANRTIGR